MEGQKRLVIVYIPGGREYDELCYMVSLLHDLTLSVTAMSYPPHVTLRTGVIVPGEELDAFANEFGSMALEERAFDIKTEGLGSFEYWEEENRKFIIFYRVKKSPELSFLNRRLLGYEKYKKSGKSGFHPHISLLYNDLDRNGFVIAKKFISGRPGIFDREFRLRLDNVTLLDQGEDGNWKIYRQFRLK